jgi:hypothetical protein
MDGLAQDLFTDTKALRALANHLDALHTAYATRQTVIDEEVEILWWVMRESDEAGLPWGEHPVLARAVGAACELKSRTKRLPGPPAANYFLTRVVGADSASTASLKDFAEAAADAARVPDGSDYLMPITTAVRSYREVSGDAKIWPALADKKFGVAVDEKHTIATSCQQLYRELQLAELLGT